MSNSPGGVTPKPPSLEKRLPLALGLMMLVLLVSQYIFKPAPGPKPVTQPANSNTATQVTEKPPLTAAAAATSSAPAPAGAVAASSEVSSEIDTALYHVVFTNRGGTVKSWVLKKYQDNAGKPLQVINTSAADVPPPFSIESTGQKLTVDPNTVLYQSKISPDRTGISYEFSDGQTTIRKSFQFGQNSYLSEVKSEVLLNNSP